MTPPGAGPSKSWDNQAGPVGDTHWFNVNEDDVEFANSDDHRFGWLPKLWLEALRNPGKCIHTIRYYGTGPGSESHIWAFFSKERMQVLSDSYSCPNMSDHHLYMTCSCCGQYG